MYIYVSMCAFRVSCDPDSQMLLITNSWRTVAWPIRAAVGCDVKWKEGGAQDILDFFFFFQSATSGWSIKLCWIPHIALECCQLVKMHIIFTLYVLSACLFVYWLLSCGSSIIIAHSQHRTNQLRRYPGPNVSVLRLKYTKTSFVLMWRPCGFFGGKLKSQLEPECREECMFLLCGTVTKCWMISSHLGSINDLFLNSLRCLYHVCSGNLLCSMHEFSCAVGFHSRESTRVTYNINDMFCSM